MGMTDIPKNGPSEKLLHDCLNARHSPIRVLQFAFLIEDIPSNISVHLCRHVHATPFVSSLRNDRQDRMNGDEAPRNTPVDMIFYCNAEELVYVAFHSLSLKQGKRVNKAGGGNDVRRGGGEDAGTGRVARADV